ncbi:hypothetical protein GIB67_004284 [Kingdonia uniflora]|uniref:Uncharacterized protein n=1 Tax=Kingdonia uniflora TaxID=39325 RepID=A0A7J7MR46_9MAGN|nr:hypothetical protein GIB67_004284 [Kingdonia uniflora]
MVSQSSSNFFDLASSGDLLNFSPHRRTLPRVLTAQGILSDVDDGCGDSDVPVCHKQTIMVANFLPLHAHRDEKTNGWCFSLDEDSLLLQMKDGLSPETKVTYVGSLKIDIDSGEQVEVARKLLEDFSCVPTFLTPDVQRKFYQGFCKQQLWPLFHYMLPICPGHSERYDKSLWLAYVSANIEFANTVMNVINSDEDYEDYVWVHDYHLMILPFFLRKKFNRVKVGFFLHSPFPSSEIYRTLTPRDDILKALLNSDVIGFHTFDYARHFLSCCSRMLGLNYECKRGYIGLEYLGRSINIKILPVGVHIGRLESLLNLPSTFSRVKELQQKFKGKRLILGVDDMDIFKGISLKLLAVEQLLQQAPKLQGKLVLVQIMNPARSRGKDVQEARREIYLTAARVNGIYGSTDYEPVIIIDRDVPLQEKAAYYSVAECCIVNAVRDGMNLVPYKYIVCRQGTPSMDEAMGISGESTRSSMLVVSEFIGCSPSLSGAIRVNPWDIDAVANALNTAITMSDSEKQLRHDRHYNYISSHDVAYWARSFMQDLERVCLDHYNKRCWNIGFGMGFRVLFLSPSFKKLSFKHIKPAYKRTTTRAIFLDYDGTIVSRNSIAGTPNDEVLSILNDLCNDTKNTVFIVSGRGKDSLSEWFAPCKMLGIAAEHGYFLRWNNKSEWESSQVLVNSNWKTIAEPVMTIYTERTDGSYIETKETALVWHHRNAESDFGSCQAKEMLDHLENVLANEPVVVKKGQDIVEVKPQGISKGLVVENLLSTMVCNEKPPDFVLCIGDDRSDEDMFEKILSTINNPLLMAVPEIFACTVGQKPSKAKYYLDDTSEVVSLLQSLSEKHDI